MMRQPPHRPAPAVQRGAALLAAMLTVTLVATFAAAALWQQWRSVEIETAERARVQTGWILTGALDWARLILREDGRSGGADYLSEPWAVPLQETRLSTFLSADKTTTDSDQEAFLSGQITDLQSRLNVANLIEANKISAPALQAFAKLFDLLGLPAEELNRMAENLRFASDTSPDNRSASQAPLMPQRIEQLTWLGLSPQSLAALRPYIALLPARTPVNLNTASAEVVYASVPTFEMADAQRLVADRDRAYFRSLSDVSKLFPEAASQFSDGQHSVATRFFEVRGRLRLDQMVVQERSVLQRDGQDVRTLWRERQVVDLPANPPLYNSR